MTFDSTRSNKRQTNGAKRLLDLNGFLASGRQEARKRLTVHESSDHSPEREDDLDYLYRTVAALIETNKGIWERCSPNKVQDYDASLRIFRRVSVPSVMIRNKTIYDGTLFVLIKMRPESAEKHFGSFPCLPNALDKIGSGPGNDILESSGELFDYSKYMTEASILHESILCSFLSVLKDHLESVQLFLGKIESWLLEPQSDVAFLKDLTGKDVKLENFSTDTLLLNHPCDHKLNLEFRIETPEHRRKLEKFVEFIKCE